jgi:hypothetical protein
MVIPSFLHNLSPTPMFFPLVVRPTRPMLLLHKKKSYKKYSIIIKNSTIKSYVLIHWFVKTLYKKIDSKSTCRVCDSDIFEYSDNNNFNIFLK